jgi:hypothetical protein
MKTKVKELIVRLEKASKELSNDRDTNKMISDGFLEKLNSLNKSSEEFCSEYYRISKDHLQWNSAYNRCNEEVGLYNECAEMLKSFEGSLIK